MNENERRISVEESIEIIKNTMEKTKYDIAYFARLFLVYGIPMLIIRLFRFFAWNRYVGADGVGYKPYEVIDAALSVTVYAAVAAALIYFIKETKNIKRGGGAYTLQLYIVWGAALFIPTVLEFATLVFDRFSYQYSFDAFATVRVSNLEAYCLFASVLSVILILGALVYTGVALKSKALTVFAVIISLLTAIFAAFGMNTEQTRDDAALIALWQNHFNGILIAISLIIVALSASYYIARLCRRKTMSGGKASTTDAHSDILSIQNTLDATKHSFARLSSLFLIYVAATYAKITLELVLTEIFSGDSMTLIYLQRISTCFKILIYVSAIAISVICGAIYFKKRAELKEMCSNHTLSLYNLWGITLFTPWVIEGVMDILSLIPAVSEDIITASAWINLIWLGLQIISLLVSGVVLNNKLFVGFSVWLTAMFPIVFLSCDKIDLVRYASSTTGYLGSICMISYIVIGIAYLPKGRGVAHGNA